VAVDRCDGGLKPQSLPIVYMMTQRKLLSFSSTTCSGDMPWERTPLHLRKPYHVIVIASSRFTYHDHMSRTELKWTRAKQGRSAVQQPSDKVAISESVPIQLAQCRRFPGLAISNAKILVCFSNEIYGSNFIKQHSETVMVWNYQNADCSLRKKLYFVIY